MHRSIDPDYYGFRDEEDGVLERVEEEAEKLMRMQVRKGAAAGGGAGGGGRNGLERQGGGGRGRGEGGRGRGREGGVWGLPPIRPWPVAIGHCCCGGGAHECRPRVMAPASPMPAHGQLTSSFHSLAQAVLDWEEKEAERQAAVKSGAVGGKGGAGGGTGGAEGEERFIAYVPLPDQQAIEAKILEMKRTDLLSKYTSEALMHQQAEAKSLLNKK